MNSANAYDHWLSTDEVAAIVIREPLVSVEGSDGVIFPATFAAAEDKKVFPGGYNIDPPEGKENVCLVDSVGSQANRIEPLFAEERYSGLIPQVVIQAGEKSVNLLDAGHRAGDAIVRCTSLQKQLQNAFVALLRGDATELAKIAPTSLVFGVWDSRDTQAKVPRLISSTIRAFDVQKLSRGAQFNPAVDYVGLQLLEDTLDKKVKDAYAERGFIHVPASGSHGGVIAKGGIRRDVTLSLAALRLLKAGSDSVKTLQLQRYILGLALVALTAPPKTYLRQGCNLVPDFDNPPTMRLVHANGKREEFALANEQALAFAKSVAGEFGVGGSQSVSFEPELAKNDIEGKGDTKATRKSAAKAKAKSPGEA